MGFLKNREDRNAAEFLRCFFERMLSGEKQIRLSGKDSKYSFLIQPNFNTENDPESFNGYIQVDLGKDGENDYRVAGSLEKEGIQPCFTDVQLKDVLLQIMVWMGQLGIKQMEVPSKEDFPGFVFELEGI